MSLYCDVALPVPLDPLFTYGLGGREAQVGARVLVPFAGQRLTGFILRLHDTAPEGIKVKPVQAILDEEPLLSPDLLELARWVADYYCAPLGEVLRGMVPLGAEVRRQFTYRIADGGRRVLAEAALHGSSRRSRLSVDEQTREFAVLNFLASGEPAKIPTLRAAAGANKALLDAMAKKRWLAREAVAVPRDARRLEKIAVLTEPATESTSEPDIAKAKQRLPRLTANQLAVMAELAGQNGQARVRDLQAHLKRQGMPQSTLSTLVRRGLVRLDDAPKPFHITSLPATNASASGTTHILNKAQTAAFEAISSSLRGGSFQPYLLFGITGSGKTAVYIAAMQQALQLGGTALLLVPEIGLTPATAAQMVAAFGGEVALLHSQLTPDERTEQWRRIHAGEARVVVGTRSAVFAPLSALKLVIVDEEHDASYKQAETPRYHGRDVAVMRAKLAGCTVVLGSATPSLESWHNAETGRYRRLELPQRVAGRPLPVVETVDMRVEFQQTGQDQLFSRQLLAETRATLDRGEQVIILLNRRGYSFAVMCRSCGERIGCENCAVSLTYHRSGDERDLLGPARVGTRLECHYCGYRRSVPSNCPHCASEHLFFLGAGAQQGEERLAELFPGARLGRMDRDTIRSRGDMERLLGKLHSGEINLLVGTQMIAKGHDIHGVTLVGVVGADYALAFPDFRAAERVFQLLTQVSGRAGRGDKPGRVLVQTYQPDHYVHRFARSHDFPGFAAREMYFRRGTRYPPLTALANVVVQSENLQEALDWTGRLGAWLDTKRPPEVRVAGPAAAPLARLKRIFRYHFLLRAERRDTLRRCLQSLLEATEASGVPRSAVVVDVDAMHLM